jgi:hypothetical protein
MKKAYIVTIHMLPITAWIHLFDQLKHITVIVLSISEMKWQLFINQFCSRKFDYSHFFIRLTMRADWANACNEKLTLSNSQVRSNHHWIGILYIRLLARSIRVARSRRFLVGWWLAVVNRRVVCAVRVHHRSKNSEWTNQAISLAYRYW